MGVFQFDVLVAHESPCTQTCSVKSQSSSEILDGFFVLGEKRVVVANDNARLWTELVGRGAQMCEEGQFRSQVHNIEDI